MFFEAQTFHSSMLIHLRYIIQVSDIVVILVSNHVLPQFQSSDNPIYNSAGKKKKKDRVQLFLPLFTEVISEYTIVQQREW